LLSIDGQTLFPAYDSGDHLHPDIAGDIAIGNQIVALLDNVYVSSPGCMVPMTADTSIKATFNSVSPISFAVHAGGGQYTDTAGVVYQADTDYAGGTIASTTAAITGTTDPTLYQSERYGNFSYNVPLANGNYTVTLKFAE